MNTYFKLLPVLIVVLGVAEATRRGRARSGRQFFQQQRSYKNHESQNYQLCKVDDTVGACLSNKECDRERGRFSGYCGATDDYCCVVDKTCGGRSFSHQAYFRNPDFPNKNSEARICNFIMHIKRKMCGVRLSFERFELANFEDGVCIRDTFTILGTNSTMSVTPICGNLTNWATTFEVKERSEVTLAMVLQGRPRHRFSIIVTQLACDNILPFQSPTYSGVKNMDAKVYVPTTTTTTAKPTTNATTNGTTEAPTNATTEAPTNATTEAPTNATTEAPTNATTEAPTNATTEATIKATTIATTVTPTNATTNTTTDPTKNATRIVATDVTTDVPTTGVPEEQPTTLTPGKIPRPSPDQVLIRAHPVPVDQVVEAVDSVPAISAFKRAFDLKVDDKCWKYEDERDTGFRIIGGTVTNLNEYPWQVALVYKNKFFCGGSLISDRHILTAAHCVFGSFSKGLDSLRISLGDHDLSTRNETQNKVGKIKSIYWHLHYNPHATHNDIAIMELQEPVTFTYGISAVKIPTDLDEKYDMANATVTGWGRFSDKHKRTNTIMKEYTAPIMNTTKCVEAWNKFPGISASFTQHICLNITMGTPCHGDSGSPLVVCSRAQCAQVGVVSFGYPLCTNVGLPAIFTRITYYKRWMDINLHQLHYV